MPGKTNSDLIRDLNTVVATSQQRIDNHERELQLHTRQVETLAKDLVDLRLRCERMDAQLAEARKELADRTTRGWSFIMMIVAAFLGAALTAVARQYFPGR